jgi:hypothetical protein
MMPSGLAKVLVFPGLRAPVQEPPKPALFKENAEAKTPPIVRIDGQARVDRLFAETLRRPGNSVSVLNAREQTISVIVELAPGAKADPIIASACPAVEICGREKLFTRCYVLDIKVCDGYVELLIKPSSAYILNWSKGKECSLPAVWLVKLLIGDRPAINLYNQFHENGKPLRSNSESVSR